MHQNSTERSWDTTQYQLWHLDRQHACRGRLKCSFSVNTRNHKAQAIELLVLCLRLTSLSP